MWQKACFRAVQCPAAPIACTEIATYRHDFLQRACGFEKNNWINLDQSGAVESSFCGKLWISHFKSRLVNFEHIQSTEETLE